MAAISPRFPVGISYGTVAVRAVGQLDIMVAAGGIAEDELLGLAVEDDDRVIVASVRAGTLEISLIFGGENEVWGEQQ